MSLPVLFALAALTLALLVAVVFARRVPPLPATPEGSHLAVAQRATAYSRVASALVFALVALALSGMDGLGQWAAAAPGLAAAAAALTIAAAEGAVWRSARTPGEASLERRTIGKFLPLRRLVLAAGSTLLSVLVLVLAGVIADPSAGFNLWQRTIIDVCVTSDGAQGRAASPFPGFFYGFPIIGSLAVAWAASGVAAWVAVRRPRNGADPTIVALDDVLRTRSLEAISGWLTIGATLGIMVTGFLGVSAALRVDCTGRTTTYVVLHTAAAILAAVMTVCAFAQLIRPTTRAAR